MTNPTEPSKRKRLMLRCWIRVGFVLWAVFAISWLANSVRTRGVDDNLLRSNQHVSVLNDAASLTFLPTSTSSHTGLVFICGSGIAAEAYAGLLRPIAEEGFPVFVIRLPYRFAPLESHKHMAMDRARNVIDSHPQVANWVLAGHSLGAALAARLVHADAGPVSAMVLVATTHPKHDDLSLLHVPVTKIYASNDGIAPPDRVLANQKLLPPHTTWVQIAGGNHSQFGRYGHQLFDGKATISREKQEALTRLAILSALAEVARHKSGPR